MSSSTNVSITPQPVSAVAPSRELCAPPPYLNRLGWLQIIASGCLGALLWVPTAPAHPSVPFFARTAALPNVSDTLTMIIVSVSFAMTMSVLTRRIARLRRVRSLRRLAAVFWFLAIITFPYFLFTPGVRFVALASPTIDALAAWLLHLTFLLSAVAYTAWLARSRRQALRPWLCPVCTYDLRATPTRCPECGHTPADASRDSHQ